MLESWVLSDLLFGGKRASMDSVEDLLSRGETTWMKQSARKLNGWQG